MSKAGMAILAAWVMGAMAAVAGIAAMSIPVLQSAGQAAPPAGALPVRAERARTGNNAPRATTGETAAGYAPAPEC